MQSMNVEARKGSFTIPICSRYLHRNINMHSHTDIYTSNAHLLDCFEGYQIEIWTCRDLGNWPIGYRNHGTTNTLIFFTHSIYKFSPC